MLVNNAGGAFDAAPVAEADLDSWQRTYDVNVLGTVRMTKALLPALRASGAGDVRVRRLDRGADLATRAGRPTPRPSTACTRWPRRCGWS